MKKIESQVSWESHTYEILWECCQKQLKIAKKNKTEEKYFLLTAMIMAFFTYESYLNHALFKTAPDIFLDEKKYFSSKNYLGTYGKLKKICELANIEPPKKSERPYQSIALLQKIRNQSAHGKTFQGGEIIKHKPDENPTIIPSHFDYLVNHENAERCITDTHELILSLNSYLINKFGKEGLLQYPLSGFLGFSIADFN